MPNMPITCRCTELAVVRVRVRVTFCIHKLTLVLHLPPNHIVAIIKSVQSVCQTCSVCNWQDARNGGMLAMGTNSQS